VFGFEKIVMFRFNIFISLANASFSKQRFLLAGMYWIVLI
jgi:hypothetical protein